MVEASAVQEDKIAALERSLAQQAAGLAQQSAQLAALQQQQNELARLRDVAENIVPNTGPFPPERPNTGTARRRNRPVGSEPGAGGDLSPRAASPPPYIPEGMPTGPMRPGYIPALQRYGMVEGKRSRSPPMVDPNPMPELQMPGASANGDGEEKDVLDRAEEEGPSVKSKLVALASGIEAASNELAGVRVASVIALDEAFEQADRLFENEPEFKKKVRGLLLKTARATSRVNETTQALENAVGEFIESVPVTVLPAFDEALKEVTTLRRQLKEESRKLQYEEKLEPITRSVFRLSMQEFERMHDGAMLEQRFLFRDAVGRYEAEAKGKELGWSKIEAELSSQIRHQAGEIERLRQELHEAQKMSSGLEERKRKELADAQRAGEKAMQKLGLDLEGLMLKREEEQKQKEEELKELQMEKKAETEKLMREVDRMRKAQQQALKVGDTNPNKQRQMLFYESMKPPGTGERKESISWRGVGGESDAPASPQSKMKKAVGATKSIAFVAKLKQQSGGAASPTRRPNSSR